MRDRSPERERARMVEQQLRRRGIEDERVLAAMARVPRELFVPEHERHAAYVDGALPIGQRQTISQPYMVALICSELRLGGGGRVLDVGAGSGYQAAVLAELADEVVAIEVIPELAEQARRNLAAAGYARVDLRVGDGGLGAPDRSPFDGIAVAAAAPEPPAELLAQLAPGGRLVVPVGDRAEQYLAVVEAGGATTTTVPCRFVPLVGSGGFRDSGGDTTAP